MTFCPENGTISRYVIVDKSNVLKVKKDVYNIQIGDERIVINDLHLYCLLIYPIKILRILISFGTMF